jgi:hypothetical protein
MMTIGHLLKLQKLFFTDEATTRRHLHTYQELDFGHFVLRNTQGIPWIFSNDKKLNQLRLRKQKK